MNSRRSNSRARRPAQRRVPQLGRNRRNPVEESFFAPSRSRSRSRSVAGRQGRQVVHRRRQLTTQRRPVGRGQVLGGHGRRRQDLVANRRAGRGRRVHLTHGRQRGPGRRQAGRGRRTAGRRGGGFFEFLRRHRTRIHGDLQRRRRGRDVAVTEVSVRAGQEWRRLRDHQKEHYHRQAGRR